MRGWGSWGHHVCPPGLYLPSCWGFCFYVQLPQTEVACVGFPCASLGLRSVEQSCIWGTWRHGGGPWQCSACQLCFWPAESMSHRKEHSQELSGLSETLILNMGKRPSPLGWHGDIFRNNNSSFLLDLFILYIMSFACSCVCVPMYMSGTYGGRNRMSYFPELQVWVFMNCHMGAGI